MASTVRKASDLKPSMKRHRDVPSKRSGKQLSRTGAERKRNDGNPDESGISEGEPGARGTRRVANARSKPIVDFA